MTCNGTKQVEVPNYIIANKLDAELNKWNHFVLTYNGSSLKLYYNGQLTYENKKYDFMAGIMNLSLFNQQSDNMTSIFYNDLSMFENNQTYDNLMSLNQWYQGQTGNIFNNFFYDNISDAANFFQLRLIDKIFNKIEGEKLIINTNIYIIIVNLKKYIAEYVAVINNFFSYYDYKIKLVLQSCNNTAINRTNMLNKIYSLLGYNTDSQMEEFSCSFKKYDLPKINNLYDYQLDIYKYNLISVLTELMYFRFIEYFSFE